MLCCVACALVAVVAWMVLRAPEPVLPLGGPLDAAAAPSPGALDEGAAAPLAAEAVEREQIDRQPGIHVTLLDNLGEPVVLGEGSPGRGYLRLRRPDAAADDGWTTITAVPTADDDGRLHWGHPGAGRYEVSLRDDLARAEIELAAGASHDMVLRLPDDVVVTTLQFVRDGKPQRGLSAALRQGGAQRLVGHSDKEGVFTLLLRAGAWSVVAQREGLASGGRTLVFDESPLLVPAGRARLSVQLAVGGASLEVRVVDREDKAVAQAAVELHGCAVGDDEPVTLTGWTGKEGRVFWSYVPPGEWQLSLRGDRLRAEPPPPLTIVAADRRLLRTVVVDRAVMLRLRLHDAFGEPFSPMDAPMPLLSTPFGDVECRRTVGKGTLRDVALLYPAVVPGAATLRCGDLLVDGEWRLLPFDALPDEELRIAGDDPDFSLQVEPRAQVDLIACLQNGRERITATTVVQHQGAPVRSAETVRPSHWRGYLPPGDYVVVVTDGAERIERIVTVARRRLQVRLRL
ncbi:MAG: hypothetical protein R3F29_08565 [Planctomycetota bacterium]